jgi:UDP-N-acetylmuramate-alanine ligase
MINISNIEYVHADYFGTFKNIKNIVDQINDQNLIYSTNFIIDPSTIYSNILGDKTEFIT